MAQQTAVEWLKDKLKETYDKEGKLPLAYTLHLVEQAKQMEKEQIMKAYDDGVDYEISIYSTMGVLTAMDSEEYYNETYSK
jgi:hypothetical protein